MITFRAPGPQLSVAVKDSRQAGRCYTITTYEVRSAGKLPQSVFDSLRAAGMLGYGQGFSVSDAREEQELLVPIRRDASGKVVAEGYEAVLNPYSQEPYVHQHRTVYVYTVTSECDSSD